MTKKIISILLASSSLLLVNGIYAGGAAVESHNKPFDGFRLGAGLGVSYFHSDFSVLDSGSYVATANLGVYNAAFAAELGYGRVLGGKYYAGAYATYQYSGINGATSDYFTVVNTINYRTTNAFGVLARVGYLFHDAALLYIEGGAQWTQFRFNFVDVGNSNYQANKLKAGFVWGVGMDYALCDDLALGVEYKQSYLSDYHKNLDAAAFPDGNQIRASQSLGTFLVKLSYSFQI